MKSQTHYTTTKETAKVFIRLGELVHVKATKKSQRGIIARKALVILEEYELREFSKQLPKFNLTPSLKINEGGRTYFI